MSAQLLTRPSAPQVEKQPTSQHPVVQGNVELLWRSNHQRCAFAPRQLKPTHHWHQSRARISAHALRPSSPNLATSAPAQGDQPEQRNHLKIITKSLEKHYKLIKQIRRTIKSFENRYKIIGKSLGNH